MEGFVDASLGRGFAFKSACVIGAGTAACETNRAPLSEDNIAFFVWLNALDLDVGDIQQFLDYINWNLSYKIQ